MDEQPLLSVQDLVKHFRMPRRNLLRPPDVVRAVDGVSFDIWRGKTLGWSARAAAARRRPAAQFCN